jgi:hypothetical protein
MDQLLSSLNAVHSPLTPNHIRQAEQAQIEQFKSAPPELVLQVSFQILAMSELPVQLRFFGAHCCSHVIKTALTETPGEQLSVIGAAVIDAIASAPLDMGTVPANKAIVSRLVIALIDAAMAGWPDVYPNLVTDVCRLATASATGAFAAMTFFTELIDVAFNPTPSLTARRRAALASELDTALEGEIIPSIIRTAIAALVLNGVETDSFAAAIPAESAPSEALLTALSPAAAAAAAGAPAPALASADALTALLFTASVGALAAAVPFATPRALSGAGGWALLQALWLQPRSSAVAGDAIVSLLSRRGKHPVRYAAELTELWGTALRLLALAVTPESRAGLGRAAQTRVLVRGLTVTLLLCRDYADALKTLDRGGQQATELITGTISAIFAFAASDSPRVLSVAGEVAAACAQSGFFTHSYTAAAADAAAAAAGGGFAAMAGAGMGAADDGRPLPLLQQAMQPLATLALRLSARQPRRPTPAFGGDAFDGDDDEEDEDGAGLPLDEAEQAARAAALDQKNRSSARRIIVSMIASAPTGFLGAFIAATASAAAGFKAADEAASTEPAVVYPLGSHDLPYSRDFNAAAAPLKAATVACDAPDFFLLDAASILVADVVAALQPLWAPYPAAAAASTATATAGDTVTDHSFPGGPQAPRAAIAAAARGLLKQLFAGVYELSFLELMGAVPRIRILAALLPVYNCGDATPAQLVEALTPMFTLGEQLGRQSCVVATVSELQRRAAALLEASLKRITAAEFGADPAVAADTLERCAALCIAPAADAAAAFTPAVADGVQGPAAPPPAAASCSQTLHTIALLLLSRYGSAQQQEAALRPRVDDVIRAWQGSTDPAVGAGAGTTAAAGVLTVAPADVLCETAEEIALTEAQTAGWAALAGATAAAPPPPSVASQIRPLRQAADHALIELTVALRSLVVYALAPSTQSAATGAGGDADDMGDDDEAASAAPHSTGGNGARAAVHAPASTSSLVGAPGGKTDTYSPALPAIVDAVLPTAVAALAWCLRAACEAAAAARPSALLVLSAPTPAHARWLMRWDALARFGVQAAAPAESISYTPMDAGVWLGRVTLAAAAAVAAVHLGGNDCYARCAGCLVEIEPLIPQLSLSQLGALWRRVVTPLLFDCPHWLYTEFFGPTFIPALLSALRDALSAAWAAQRAAETSSGTGVADAAAAAAPTFGGMLLRLRGPSRRPPAAAGSGGPEASELETELEILDDGEIADVALHTVEALLLLLHIPMLGQRHFDALASSKVNGFAAAQGDGVAANAALPAPCSPVVAALESDLGATVGLLATVVQSGAYAARTKALRVLRALTYAACARGNGPLAEAVTAVAESALAQYADEVAAAKTQQGRGAGRGGRGGGLGGSSADGRGEREHAVQETVLLLRDLLVGLHGVSPLAIDMLARVPGATNDHVGTLLSFAAGDAAGFVGPEEAERQQKLVRAAGANKVQINARTRKQFETYLERFVMISRAPPDGAQ